MLVIHEQVTRQRRPLVSTARFTRILIVDDNVLNRKIARHMLEQLGYQESCIFTASNGVEAIACIASKMFDVIILDNQMPIMGGEEAARRIRLRWPAHADRPYIIGSTASATEQARQMCLDSGMSLPYVRGSQKNTYNKPPLKRGKVGSIFTVRETQNGLSCCTPIKYFRNYCLITWVGGVGCA